MENRFSEFVVGKIPDRVSWYDVYSTLRQYSTVIRPSAYESEQKEDIDPTRELSRCEVLKVKTKQSKKVQFFWLLKSDRTEQLKLLKKIKCGCANVPIKWTRNVAIMKQAKAASEPPPPTLPLNCDYVLDSLQHQALTEKYLCTIVRTEFGDFAKKVFKSRYEASTIRLQGYKWTLQECEVLFMEFGQFITSIEVDASPIYTDIIVGFIANYCPAIKFLQCCRIDAIGRAIKGYKKLTQIQQKKVAAPFRKLHELVCHSRQVTEMTLPSIELPSLRVFSLSGGIFRKRAKIEPFFEKNANITMLSLHMVNLRFQLSYILRNLSHIRELNFQEIRGVDDMPLRKNIKYLSRMQQLTTIKWKPVYETGYLANTMKAIFQADLPLKCVDLKISNFNPAFIGRMSNIEQVQVFGIEPDRVPRVAAYIEMFPHLEKIENSLTGKDYMIGFKRIVKSLKNDLMK